MIFNSVVGIQIFVVAVVILDAHLHVLSHVGTLETLTPVLRVRVHHVFGWLKSAAGT